MLLENQPLDEAIPEADENAKDLAMGETDLSEQTFPSSCPYSLSEILGDRFYPGESSELVDTSKVNR